MVAAIGVLQLSGGTATSASLPVATAGRGDVIVSVGGVGRIVEAAAPSDIVVPSAAPASSGSTSGATVVPGDAVFPHATGHVRKFLVQPGQNVRAGQPVAELDDGGAAAGAVRLAELDLAAARLEQRQKRTHDPQRGLPPTASELTAGRAAVLAARAKLARVLGPALQAEVGAARLDVDRAASELAVLRGGTPKARAAAIAIARHNVALAQARAARVLAPAHPADVAAADADVAKAQADLAALQSPSPDAVAAAQQAVSAAQAKLSRLTGPPDPVAVAAAELEVGKAEADQAALARLTDPKATPAETAAAQKAVDVAKQRLDRANGPADPVDVASAQLDLSRARAELAPLQSPSPAAVASAKSALAAAQAKRDRLTEAAQPADAKAAALDLARAQEELRLLRAGPTPAALAAARQAARAAGARLAQLLGPPLASDVTSARLDVDKAVADLAVLRARGGPAAALDVELAGLKARAAEARLAVARSALRQLTVVSPSSGTVRALLTVDGAPVDPVTPVVAVADLRHLAVDVALSEFDAAAVERGLRAVVSVDALGGKSFPGTVLFAALTGTDNGGVVSFPVRVGLGRTAAGLKPGMTVSVRIVVAQRRNVVEVPLEAVARDRANRPFVTVVAPDGKTAPRAVKLGLANNKVVEIAGGLRAGEHLVLPGSGGA